MLRTLLTVSILSVFAGCATGPSQEELDAQADQIDRQCDAIYNDPKYTGLQGLGVIEYPDEPASPPERLPTPEERQLVQQLNRQLLTCRTAWLQWYANFGPDHVAATGRAQQASVQNLDLLAAGGQTFAKYAAIRGQITASLNAGVVEADAKNEAAAQAAQAYALQNLSNQLQQQQVLNQQRQLQQQQMYMMQNQRMQTTCTTFGNIVTCR